VSPFNSMLVGFTIKQINLITQQNRARVCLAKYANACAEPRAERWLNCASCVCAERAEPQAELTHLGRSDVRTYVRTYVPI